MQQVSAEDHFRQLDRDRLVKLQTEKLRREEQVYHNRESRRQAAEFIALISALLMFIFKHPKTTFLLLIIGYGAMQFGAPAQGAEFNRWVITLITNPSQAESQFRTTFIPPSNSDNLTVTSPDNAAVSSTSNGLQTAPVSTTSVAPQLPAEAAPPPMAVNPMCKQLKWSNPDDLPYLHYYKCPSPTSGD
jgi:hypothetical protein